MTGPGEAPGRHPLFSKALAALDSGDLHGLEQLLRQHPDLARARETSTEAPYDGYFHGATLLHHVAGNPVRGELPANIGDLTRLLLQHGNAVDATCGGGPSQPESGGGTTLGLVASGAQAHRQGVTGILIDTLLEAGASLDPDGKGGLMWLALFHVVEHRGQREVAGMLRRRGHPVDLCFAAGLGELETMDSLLADSRRLAEGDRLYRHHRAVEAEAGPEAVLQDALLFASVCGRLEALERLLAAGADPDVPRPWGPERPTPLQGAAWAGWAEVAERLLEAGADPWRRDPRHNSTALGWAIYCRRREVVEVLAADPERIDVLDALELGRWELLRQRLGNGDPDMELGIAPRGVLLRNAAHLGYEEAVRLLLELGADPELRGPSGQSPLDLAEAAGHAAVAELLRRKVGG